LTFGGGPSAPYKSRPEDRALVRERLRVDAVDYERLNELVVEGDVKWMARAACNGEAVNFFPERGNQAWAARAMCAGCPVRLECLAYGLEDQDGIWGGFGAAPREKIRVKWRAEYYDGPDHGTTARYSAGCKCGECRKANTAYKRERDKWSA